MFKKRLITIYEYYFKKKFVYIIDNINNYISYTQLFYNKIFLISVFLESYTIYDINDCEQIVKAYYHLDNSIIYNCIIKNYNDNKYKIIKTKKN